MARRHARRAVSDADQGFTLIEVIVALMLMSVVLMAGGAFMIRAMTTSSAVSGRQGAIAVANQVMEQVRAVNATFDDDGVSPLVYGRAKADVQNQWSLAGIDAAQTYTGSGSTTYDAHTYHAGGAVTLPLQQTLSLNNQSYTVDTLIGTCGRETLNSECKLLLTGFELYRVVIRVTWSPGAGQTCAGGCEYIVSTLIDATKDPTFNATRKPLAKADTAITVSGTVVNIGVTANDSGDFALAGAVVIASGPSHGSYTITNNIVIYTPTAGYSGTDTFTYTVTDLTARTSDVATVTITVAPVGVNDTASTVTAGSAITVAVLGNDLGTGLSLVSLSGPSLGSAVISGTTIAYTAPATGTGTATLTYTAKDSAGQSYTGTLTITITASTAVPLGTVSTYSVFSGSTISNSNSTTLSGDIGATGVISGFPPGTFAGASHSGDAAATSARTDLTTAYTNAAGRTAGSTLSGTLAGQTLTAGVYKTSGAATLNGTVTLNGGGNPNAVFIIQVNGTLTAGTSSIVTLTNGTQAKNVFWQVNGATGIGASSSFAGTVLSGGAITMGSAAQVNGRALSYLAVTLVKNTFT